MAKKKRSVVVEDDPVEVVIGGPRPPVLEESEAVGVVVARVFGAGDTPCAEWPQPGNDWPPVGMSSKAAKRKK